MRIALVEDDFEDLDLLKKHIQRYEESESQEIVCDSFINSFVFLENYRPDYDLVIFDIETPVMNGLEGAQKLRDLNPTIPIVFETNMKQYAVKGYAVNALDFIFKPVTYFAMESMLNKVKKIMALSTEKDIIISSKGITHHISSNRIRYVEVYGHKLTVHTVDGEIEAWVTLSEIEKQLSDQSFSKSSSGFLVNLKYVDYLDKDKVHVGKDALPLARLRKKDFLQDLTRYLRRHK